MSGISLQADMVIKDMSIFKYTNTELRLKLEEKLETWLE